MFMIGIDPHKGSHTAVVVDRSEAVLDTIRVDADRFQRERLLAWAARFEPRTWAVEGATGLGAMLAQQLVAAGEHVVDVPAKLSSRVRLLERGRIDKTDPNDARSAAIVAWRTPALNVVAGLDEHTQQRVQPAHGAGPVGGDLMITIGQQAQHDTVLIEAGNDVQRWCAPGDDRRGAGVVRVGLVDPTALEQSHP